MDPVSLLTPVRQLMTGAAREELLPRFARVVRMRKRDGSILTEADLAVQSRVAGPLLQLYPDAVFLSEEMEAGEQEAQLASGRPVWCLDPLDGTSNFAAGIPYYCVSLALLEGGEVTLGLVYDPVRDECFTACRGAGAQLNESQLQVKPAGLALGQSIALIDFKRLEPSLAMRLVTGIPYASQRSFGSVALDWCWLASGRCHIYLHGRSSLWDYAAGNFIFDSAGGHSVSLDGRPVFAHTLKRRASVAAVDAALFRAWTEWLGIVSK